VPIVYAENLFQVMQGAGVDVTMKTVPGGHVAHLAHAAEVNAEIRAWVVARLTA
jgi:pimeloyl-ACP methyl ester carboxylesterase